MTYEELLKKIDDECSNCLGLMAGAILADALTAVVKLHKPEMLHRGYEQCIECGYPSQYPCETIQAIEKSFDE